jgi:hypothetical protein
MKMNYTTFILMTKTKYPVIDDVTGQEKPAIKKNLWKPVSHTMSNRKCAPSLG